MQLLQKEEAGRVRVQTAIRPTGHVNRYSVIIKSVDGYIDELGRTERRGAAVSVGSSKFWTLARQLQADRSCAMTTVGMVVIITTDSSRGNSRAAETVT